MNKPVLIVLAAGMGSRYGGLKQMESFGKNGEVLLDYSVYDALRGGFTKIVFVIRKDIEKDFEETVLRRIEGKIDYTLAYQEMDRFVPPEIFTHAQQAKRTKPWGTAHALLCGAENLDAPFAVINSDDFYGQEAFAAMGNFLASPGGLEEGAIVPYRLASTLSPTGGVSRGVCEVAGGYLTSIEELKAIEMKDSKIFNTAPEGSTRELSPDTPVSMNFLGYPPKALPQIREYFDDFIASSGKEPNSESYIPKASDYLIQKGYLKMKVLHADSPWFGVTYKEDRPEAIRRLQELHAQGVYPESLWG